MVHFLDCILLDNDLFNGIITLICHVVFCALFSTFLWNWLYDAQSDFACMWSASGDNASPSAIMVAATFFCLVAAVASTIAFLMAFSWKRTIVFLVHFAHLALLLTLPMTIFADLLELVPISHHFRLILLSSLVSLYFAVGSLALFTDRLSTRIQRLLIALNCSLISVMLLRCFPPHTVWHIILVDIAWDLFSVLAGPVRTMFEKSHEYEEKLVRCVLFSAEDEQHTDDEEKEASKDETKSGERTANNALGGVQLGIGDFVLFAFLVARAWSDHPSGAAAALVGLIVGLFVNFVVAFSYARKKNSYFFVPAVPCPMLLGMGLHFGTLSANKIFFGTNELKAFVL